MTTGKTSIKMQNIVMMSRESLEEHVFVAHLSGGKLPKGIYKNAQ